jgi:serine protease Do
MKRLPLILACLVLGGTLTTFAGRQLLKGQPVNAPAPVIPKELTSYRDIVKRVLPAVVSVESRAQGGRHGRGLPLDNPFGGPDDGGDDNGPARIGFGSGFLVDPKGVVLTNFHVVDGADEVLVQLRDGRKFTSKTIKTDPKSDLAIIKLDAKAALPYLEFGDSSAMEIGDRVLAVGAPFGLTGSVTHGIISAKGRSLHMNMYEDFLQTDAAINPGNSGGPLINLEGKVIGIDAAIKSRSGGFQGVGLAIASNLAQNVMEQLLKNGVVRRGYLGVQIQDVVDADLAARLGMAKDQRGVLVSRVFPDTPGAKAGLQKGDVILTLAGKPVADGKELQGIVARLPVGKPAPVAILREGQPKTLQVTIEEQPQDYGTVRQPAPRGPGRAPQSVVIGRIGVEAVDLTPELADNLGFKDGAKGVVIVRVQRNGLAGQAGLRRGVVVTKVDKKAVRSAKELSERLTAEAVQKGVLLELESPEGGTSYVLLKSGAARDE